MKKVITILLALLLALSLCACGGRTTADNENNGAKSESAVVSSFSENDLIGEWYSVATTNKITIENGGTFSCLEPNGYETPGKWEMADNAVTFSWKMEGDWTIENKDGVICLTTDDDTLYRWEDLPRRNLTIGEAADDGTVQVTLNHVSFTSEVIPPREMDSEWVRILNLELERNPLGQDMTYIRLDCTFTNNGKTEVLVGDINRKGDFVLDYNNGFLYSTRGSEVSYFISGNDYIGVSSTGTSGNSIAVRPLETKQVLVYIECPERVANDAEADLSLVYMTLYNSNAIIFDYNLKGNTYSAEDQASEFGGASTKEIEEELQGMWTLPEKQQSFTFADGAAFFVAGTNAGDEAAMSGTYQVNTETSRIDVTFPKIIMHVDYTYENGTLVLKDNQGVELEKTVDPEWQ